MPMFLPVLRVLILVVLERVILPCAMWQWWMTCRVVGHLERGIIVMSQKKRTFANQKRWYDEKSDKAIFCGYAVV